MRERGYLKIRFLGGGMKKWGERTTSQKYGLYFGGIAVVVNLLIWIVVQVYTGMDYTAFRYRHVISLFMYPADVVAVYGLLQVALFVSSTLGLADEAAIIPVLVFYYVVPPLLSIIIYYFVGRGIGWVVGKIRDKRVGVRG